MVHGIHVHGQEDNMRPCDWQVNRPVRPFGVFRSGANNSVGLPLQWAVSAGAESLGRPMSDPAGQAVFSELPYPVIG